MKPIKVICYSWEDFQNLINENSNFNIDDEHSPRFLAANSYSGILYEICNYPEADHIVSIDFRMLTNANIQPNWVVDISNTIIDILREYGYSHVIYIRF